MKKTYINNLITFFFLIIPSFFITSYSSVVNAYSGDIPNDSWIFRYMGMLIDKGGVPYKDAFEQKGPFLFLLEYLGLKIHREYGIWIIELLSMTFFLYFTYILCVRFTNRLQAIICSVFSASSISIFFYGNNCEEFALPFIALSIYIFTLYFLFNEQKALNIAICGMCCGLVFLLRPNMVSLWLVMTPAVIIRFIIRYKKYPVKLTLLFTLGFISAVQPIALWLLYKGGLYSFIEQYFIFNFQYTEDGYTTLKQLSLMYSFFRDSLMIIPVAVLIISAHNKKYRYYSIVFLLYIFTSLIMCTVSVRGYLHYGMPLVTVHAYPLALLTAAFNGIKKKNTMIIPYFIYAAYAFTLIAFSIGNISTFIKTINEYEKTEHEKRLLDTINELTDENEPILVLGAGADIYYKSDRLSSSKYFIQVPIYDVNSFLKEDIKNDINSSLPGLLIDRLRRDDEENEYGSLFDHYDDYELTDPINGLYILKE